MMSFRRFFSTVSLGGEFEAASVLSLAALGMHLRAVGGAGDALCVCKEFKLVIQ